MTTTVSPSIPQTRPLSDSDVEGPVLKKQRLDAEVEELDAEVLENSPIDAEGQDGAGETVISLESAQNRAPKHKKKNKKKKDPPLPEPCSPADVLYQEIRELLGGDVVDRVTEAGGAFKSPYEFGEEVEVKVVTLGSGGKWCCRTPQFFLWF